MEVMAIYELGEEMVRRHSSATILLNNALIGPAPFLSGSRQRIGFGAWQYFSRLRSRI